MKVNNQRETDIQKESEGFMEFKVIPYSLRNGNYCIGSKSPTFLAEYETRPGFVRMDNLEKVHWVTQRSFRCVRLLLFL